ncbi:MAG: hypothetical protein OEW19_03985 [Acidobacteriota bacterium]|nr:hypothetical protein [Acidobacteriota bacterium]
MRHRGLEPLPSSRTLRIAKASEMAGAPDPVPGITPTPNGPYVVENLETLHGFSGAASHETNQAVALCRSFD